MWTPPEFRHAHLPHLLQVVRRYPFGLLTCNGSAGVPHLTHLPFIATETPGGGTVLHTHLARANPQAGCFAQPAFAVAVFAGPHGYVSPTHYSSPQNVPTWNYIAVHAHGTCRALPPEAAEDVLLRTIAAFEPSYHTHYEALAPTYRSGLHRGIVALELVVERWEAQFKLSQNKSEEERNRIADAFAQHTYRPLHDLAEWMLTFDTPFGQ
jgi:transcriptional regulator